MSFDLRSGRQLVRFDGVTEFTGSVLKWFLVLNLGLGWLLFWGNLARLHLSMGDFPAVLLTVTLFIGPVVIAIPWWLVKKANRVGAESDTGPLDSRY